METFYLICAGAGGALIVCQFLAALFGLVGDHDTDTHTGDADHDVHDTHHETQHDQDHASNWFLGLLTFRSVAAAVTFFGLGGMTATYYGATPVGSFTTAIVAGIGALYLVASLMKAMAKLKADGSVRMERAIGQVGRVYLTIPAKRAGQGKVTLNVQNRTVECQALSSEGELSTGTAVKVIALIGPNLVEVAAM